MTKAYKIFKSLEMKKESIRKIDSWISLNPTSSINIDLKKQRINRVSEIGILEKELNDLYEKSI
jgi:hypothetical protein